MPDDQGALPTLSKPRQKPPATVGELLTREDETTRRLTAVATKYLPAERAMRLAIMAVRRTPNLAACDPVSFMGSLMGSTGLGLEPNTPKQHAFLIPYKQRKPRRDQNNRIMTDDGGKWLWDEYYECQLQVGYKGFVSLFYRTGVITEVTAEAIHEGDLFKHRKGTETFLQYEKSLGDRGELLGSFCFTRLTDGQSFTVLPTEEIYKLRSRSQTYTTLVRNVDEAQVNFDQTANDRNRRALERATLTLAETPWVMWQDEMSSKSAIRRHAKQQDLGTDVNPIAIAADLDALGDAGVIDMKTLADPEFAKAVMQGEEEVAAGQSGDGETATTAGPATTADQDRGERSAENGTGAQPDAAAAGEAERTASSTADRKPAQEERRDTKSEPARKKDERKGLFS